MCLLFLCRPAEAALSQCLVDNLLYNRVCTIRGVANRKGQRLWSYLNWGHLSITSPAEIGELLGVVAESHRPAVQHASLLNLKLQVMEVREVVIRTRSAGTGSSMK